MGMGIEKIGGDYSIKPVKKIAENQKSDNKKPKDNFEKTPKKESEEEERKGVEIII